MYRNHLHNNFFIKTDRPRCEMRPVLLIFALLHIFCYTKHLPGHVAKFGRFFVPSRIWPFLGDLRAFRRLGGTSYRPRRKSVLNRKFAENNFFWPKT